MNIMEEFALYETLLNDSLLESTYESAKSGDPYYARAMALYAFISLVAGIVHGPEKLFSKPAILDYLMRVLHKVAFEKGTCEEAFYLQNPGNRPAGTFAGRDFLISLDVFVELSKVGRGRSSRKGAGAYSIVGDRFGKSESAVEKIYSKHKDRIGQIDVSTATKMVFLMRNLEMM